MESSIDSSYNPYEKYESNITNFENYKVLVLSGGGLKGIVQLGILHRLSNNTNNKKFDNDSYLDDLLNNISLSSHPSDNINLLSEIKYYVGTSIGSIICLLLIIGISPSEILSHICANFDTSIKLDIQSILTKCGATSPDFLFDRLLKVVEDKIGFIPTMDELYETFHKEFTVVTYNITTDETVYIDYKSHPNLSCIEALKMSCNIPIVFEKYMYDKCFYIDGGVSDNFPIEYAKDKYKNEKILGLNVDKVLPRVTEFKDDDLLSYIKVLTMLSFRMNCRKSKNFKAENVDVISVTLKSDFPEFKFNLSNSPMRFSLFSIGYKVADEIFNREEGKKKDD